MSKADMKNQTVSGEANGGTILEVRGLKKYFPTKRGLLHAVDDVNFSIEKGKTMGLVGESGCGKSTVGRLLLRLTGAKGGEILGITAYGSNRGRNLVLRGGLEETG